MVAGESAFFKVTVRTLEVMRSFEMSNKVKVMKKSVKEITQNYESISKIIIENNKRTFVLLLPDDIICCQYSRN
jgi:uncharacterized protein (UPF0128 family)